MSISIKIEGSWTANGHHVTPQMMTGISGYVHQDELFIGSLTIREHLMFQVGSLSLVPEMANGTFPEAVENDKP